MLRTDLVDLLNKGNVWAFVGAGASVDAGAPTWAQLVDRVLGSLSQAMRTEIAADSRFAAAYKSRNFPRCFSRIQQAIGRASLEDAVQTEIRKHKNPGDLMRQLANWPFAGYVTTNYDTLIRRALRAVGGAGGWADAGNSPDEIRKLSGNVEHLIWHVHGAIDHDPASYRMVITEEDYDGLYLETSRIAGQLKSLLTQRRVVFLGFSFEDAELQRLLKTAALYCNPARPAYAFLSGLGGSDGEQKRIELLERFNVDVIPYELVGDSHARLIGLLRVYGSFILKRDQKFGQPQRRCPSYHHETTSLLVYNKLAATRTVDIAGDTLGSLLKARVISLLKFKGPQTFEALANDMAERIRVLHGTPPSDLDNIIRFIRQYVSELSTHGLVEDTDPIRLTEKGAELTGNQAAAAKTLHEQFASSLLERALEVRGSDDASAKRIAEAAEGFFVSCTERLALA
jgi:SIR2-like domain